MKKILYLSLFCLSITPVVHSKMAPKPNKPTKQTKKIDVSSTPSQTTQITSPKIKGSLLEQRLYDCIQSYAPHLEDLDSTNLSQKKPHIQAVRQELLQILEESDFVERMQYAELEKALSQLNIDSYFKMFFDMKKLVKTLPTNTKNLMRQTIKNPGTRNALGL